MMEHIAIIGAGIAGLQLARRLQAAGISASLFDKARGPAGRIATRRLDYGRFDHGAQYFTARDPVFAAQVEDWCARGVVAPWTGRIVTLSDGAIQPEPSPVPRHVGVPSMSAMARDLASGANVTVGVRIASVRRTNARWVLVADDGLEFDGFDGLVSAVPAPQAVAFLAGSTELALNARSAQFDPCHALMIDLEEPVSATFDAAFVEHSPVGWIARESSKPGRAASNGWVVHSTAAWSRANVDRKAEEVLAILSESFAAALGKRLPGIRGAAVHRWLYARARGPFARAVPWDGAAGLGVCGDWLRGDRIEDAYLSAERLADAMLASRERNELR